MGNVTGLQKRILLAALSGQGRLILWVLKDGRFNLPGFSGDVADAVRSLESAGILAPHDALRRITSLPAERAPGSYVYELTESGWRAAHESVGRGSGETVRRDAAP